MVRVAISLRQQLQRKILLLLGVVFFFITLISVYFSELQHRSFEKQSLELRHQIVEQVFNSYLTRAEYEMSFIGQNLLLKDYKPRRELEMLFSNNDVLFFGGLDFFYIEWMNGQNSTDPRARLFTKVDLKTLLPFGRINQWIKETTNDGAVFLIHKKKLISENQINRGFLYGFISLNNNLTLANELLESSQANMVRIYDNANNNVLLEERQVGEDLDGDVLESRRPLLTSVDADLQLELVQKNKSSETVLSRGLVPTLFIGLVLFCLYLMLAYLARKWIFLPLKAVAYQNDYDVLPFIELQPIQEQNNQDKAFIKAKDSRFQLLTESTYNAIIFCSEVAEIEMINNEAKSIFPDHKYARTIFDFMPITCHQAIQEALKGGVGVTFDLTIANIGRIYNWRAYSFKNESSYRGIVLIGRDMTYESSLLWQLEQLRPTVLTAFKKVEAGTLLDEFKYLSTLPEYISPRQLQGWLLLLNSILDNIALVDRVLSHEVLGETVAQESLFVAQTLGLEVSQLEIECTVDVGAIVLDIDVGFRSLVRILCMLALVSDIEDKRLSIYLKEDIVELSVTSDMASRLLPAWLVSTLLELLGGEQKAYTNNLLLLHLPIGVVSEKIERVNEELMAAWVVNDYSNADHVRSILLRLGWRVEQYASADSFFTQSRSSAKFDAVLIGGNKDIEAQANMAKVLKAQYHRDDLPLVWLNDSPLSDTVENHLMLSGCVFDYNLHETLQKACLFEGIVPMGFDNDSQAWVIVGGGRVAKAILYAELEQREIASKWLADISSNNAVLSHHSDAVLVLLEPQSKEGLLVLQANFPSIQIFSLQRWADMPDNVMVFEMEMPYSSDKITMLKEYVDTKISHIGSNE